MKQWHQITLGVLIGLLASGLILLLSRPQQGKPVLLSPAPTPTQTLPPEPTASPAPLIVQIGGEIQSPGIYSITVQARLGDLIDLAGGLTAVADMKRVNYAAIIRDGDYFYIPAVDETIPNTARNAPQNSTANSEGINFPLDLNQASQDELESLPGIGPTKAADIVAYRDQFGPFFSIDQLVEVPGIGEAIIDGLREYLVIAP